MVYATMCHHWEAERLEDLEAELEEVADEPPETETPDAEDAAEPDEDFDLLEVPPADD